MSSTSPVVKESSNFPFLISCLDFFFSFILLFFKTVIMFVNAIVKGMGEGDSVSLRRKYNIDSILNVVRQGL